MKPVTAAAEQYRDSTGADHEAGFGVQRVGEGCYRLSGALSFPNARSALRMLTGLLRDERAEVLLDLQAVTRADSAGLALLIEILRFARQRDVGLRFRNLPAQVQALAAVSGVSALLPAAAPAPRAPSQP